MKRFIFCGYKVLEDVAIKYKKLGSQQKPGQVKLVLITPIHIVHAHNYNLLYQRNKSGTI